MVSSVAYSSASSGRLSDGSQIRTPPTSTQQVIKRFFSGPHPLRNLGLPNSQIPSRTASPAQSGSMSQRKESYPAKRLAQPYGRI